MIVESEDMLQYTRAKEGRRRIVNIDGRVTPPDLLVLVCESKSWCHTVWRPCLHRDSHKEDVFAFRYNVYADNRGAGKDRSLGWLIINH